MLCSQILTQRICLSFETSSFHAVGWLGLPISLRHRFTLSPLSSLSWPLSLVNHYHYRHQNRHHYFDQWSPTTGLAVPLTCCVLLNKRVSVLQSFQRSKHLKGHLDPPVCKVTFFWIKAAQLDPHVCNVTFLDHQGGQLDPPVCQRPKARSETLRKPQNVPAQ